MILELKTFATVNFFLMFQLKFPQQDYNNGRWSINKTHRRNIALRTTIAVHYTRISDVS